MGMEGGEGFIFSCSSVAQGGREGGRGGGEGVCKKEGSWAFLGRGEEGEKK
jgi:hypothetical protein